MGELLSTPLLSTHHYIPNIIHLEILERLWDHLLEKWSCFLKKRFVSVSVSKNVQPLPTVPLFINPILELKLVRCQKCVATLRSVLCTLCLVTHCQSTHDGLEPSVGNCKFYLDILLLYLCVTTARTHPPTPPQSITRSYLVCIILLLWSHLIV